MEPTPPQLRSLYEICYTLTNIMFHPLHIVRLDERTGYLFILAGLQEQIEWVIDKKGRVVYDRQV